MRNESGVSLIETIIASAIGVVVMMALGELMMSQQNSTRDVMQTYEMASVLAELTEHLSDSANCLQNFGGRNPNTSNIGSASFDRILDSASVARYVEGNQYGGGLLTLADLDIIGAAVAIPGNGKGSFNLRMTFQRRGQAIGALQVPMDLPIFVRTNAAGLVIACSSQGISGNLNCIYPTLTCFGCNTQQPACPAGYVLTGGGIYDDDTSKNAFHSHPVVPGTPGFPAGGWRCGNGDPGLQVCKAICCRSL